MIVGVLKVTLYLPENHSLKGKRGVIKKIKARVANDFNVSVSETDAQDLWQRAEIGVCMAGSDAAYVEGALRQVVQAIDAMQVAQLGEDQIEILRM